jgi:hypothetical protein
MNKPTSELYNAIQIAYEHFNNELFTGVLPPVIFTTRGSMRKPQIFLNFAANL